MYRMATLFVIVTGEEIFNVVLCAGSEQQYILGCGPQEIIDIHSITVAYVPDIGKCTVDTLVPKIGNIQPPCRRSAKTPEKTDGLEVYKRYLTFPTYF